MNNTVWTPSDSRSYSEMVPVVMVMVWVGKYLIIGSYSCRPGCRIIWYDVSTKDVLRAWSGDSSAL